MAAATGQPQEWIETGGTSPPSTAPAPAGRRRLLQTSSGRVLVQNKVWGWAGKRAEGLLLGCQELRQLGTVQARRRPSGYCSLRCFA